MQGMNCRVYPQRCFMLASIKWGEENHHHLTFEGWLLPPQKNTFSWQVSLSSYGFPPEYTFLHGHATTTTDEEQFLLFLLGNCSWLMLPSQNSSFQPNSLVKEENWNQCPSYKPQFISMSQTQHLCCFNTYYTSNSFVRLENVCTNSPNTTPNNFMIQTSIQHLLKEMLLRPLRVTRASAGTSLAVQGAANCSLQNLPKAGYKQVLVFASDTRCVWKLENGLKYKVMSESLDPIQPLQCTVNKKAMQKVMQPHLQPNNRISSDKLAFKRQIQRCCKKCCYLGQHLCSSG